MKKLNSQSVKGFASFIKGPFVPETPVVVVNFSLDKFESCRIRE